MPASSRRPVSVHLILLVVQVCFASLAVVGKKALVAIPPGVIVSTRVAGGALVFFLLARRQGPLRVARGDLGRLVLCALFGVVVNQLLFVNGLERSTATSASVLGTTIPVFTTVFAVAAGAERLRRWRALGIAIALAGALVLVRIDRFSWSDRHAVGNLMIVANSASYAIFLVIVRPLAGRVAPMPLVALLFACAVPFVGAAELGAWIRFAPRLDAGAAGFLAFLVAVPTVAAYALNQIALARAESSLVASYIYVQPVVAALGAWLYIHEVPEARLLVAAPLVFLGVWVSARA